jgi:hypothetical protein
VLAKGGAMTGQASWLVILGVIAVIAGLVGFWLREWLEQRRESRNRRP